MAEISKAGDALLFSFPYWVLCDNSETFPVATPRINRTQIRVYPPFRSGKPNFTPMPPIDPHKLPFLDGRAPNIDPKFKFINLSVVPGLKNEEQDANLKLMWGEEWDETPDVMPMDSLRIDVLNNGNEKKNEIAVNFVSHLINHLRVDSSQWWIGRSVESMLGIHRAAFAIDKFGTPLETPYGLSQGRSPFGFEKPITKELWSDSILKAQQSKIVPEELVLISDAYFFAATGELRRAIIDAAIAAELVKDNAFEIIWRRENRGKNYRRGKILSGYDLPSHIDKDLKILAGVAFSDDFPKEAQLINRLWKLRGKVAHGLPLTFSSGKGMVKLDTEPTSEMIGAVKLLIGWLRTL